MPSLEDQWTGWAILVIHFHETRINGATESGNLQFPIENLAIFMLSNSIAHKVALS